MVTAQQCTAHSMECKVLSGGRNVSIQRATVLMAMARSWLGLANQTERYEAIVKQETKVDAKAK